MSQSLAEQLATTALSGGNADFIEDLYEQFLRDPSGVDPTWAAYFKRLQGGASGEVAHTPIRERLSARLTLPPARSGPQSAESGGASAKQGAVSRLIQVYANRGHLVANLDPLGLQERAKPYVLDLEYFGLSEADLDTGRHLGGVGRRGTGGLYILVHQVLELRAPHLVASGVGVRQVVGDIVDVHLLGGHAAGSAIKCSDHWLSSLKLFRFPCCVIKFLSGIDWLVSPEAA